MTRYWEDFVPGQTFELGSLTVDGEEMLAFSRRFDPQPFHVDPVAAANSPFGGIIASGWFTGSLFMRLWADAVLADSTSQGASGMSELRWLSPVRAGDVLTGAVNVLASYPSAKNPNRGSTQLRGQLTRGGEPVMTCEFRGLFGRREPAPPTE